MRVVNIKLLPDGSGRCRIHWFMIDPAGPISTKKEVRMLKPPNVVLTLGGARGRIACMPLLKSDLPQQLSDGFHVMLRSDDIRAVNCPECLATEEAKKQLQFWQEYAQQVTN